MVEVMIVVVGIFIGLQVDDWNPSKQDRQEEKLLIDLLIVETKEVSAFAENTVAN